MTQKSMGRYRNVGFLKKSCAALLVIMAVILSLELLDISKGTWSNKNVNQGKTSTHSANMPNKEFKKSHHATYGDISVISEQDINAELLLQLQDSSIQESKKGPEWKKFSESTELLLKSKIDLAEESVSLETEAVKNTCQPQTHIMFLKTHKTASSTIMNILFRYGEAHNLTFAFPARNISQFFYPAYFSAYFVDGYSPKNSGKFHIMCHHMRFLLTEVEKVMPSDTFYFTILRNPVSLMESLFSYFSILRTFAKAKNLEDFLDNSSKFYNVTDKYNSYAKNVMTFDLGFDHNGPETLKQFQLTCGMIETTFNLIMIAEYFDESLILLKDALCWTIDDVLSFPLNIRSNDSKMTISHETEEKIKKWNQLDWHLYVYFNNSFWNRVDRFGRQQMQREVEELRRKRVLLEKTCLQDEGLVEPAKLQDKFMIPYQPGVAKILGYNLKPGLMERERLICQRIVTPELQYSDLLHKKQKIKLLQTNAQGKKIKTNI